MAPLDPVSDSGGANHDASGSDNGHAAGSQVVAGGTLARVGAGLPSTAAPLNWSYGPPPKPEILSAKPNPAELMHAVRRRWTLAVGMGSLVAGILAALLWVVIPVKYEAYATLKIANTVQHVFDSKSTTNEQFALLKATQKELITGNLVLNAVLREASIMQLPSVHEHSDDPVGWLKEELLISFPGDAELMRVAIRTKRRDDSLKIVNKVVEVYLREIVQVEKQNKHDHQAKVRTAFEKLNADYTMEYNTLTALEKQHGTAGSDAAQLKKMLAIEELKLLIAQRNGLINDRNSNDMLQMLMKTKADGAQATPHLLIEMELERDPEIARTQQMITAYQQNLGMLQATAITPNATPQIAEMQRNIMQLENHIEELKGQRRPKLMELFELNASRPQANQLSPEQLAKQREYIDERLLEAEKAVAEKTAEVTSLESFSATVAAQQERLENMRQIKNQLSTEIERIKIEALAPDRIIKVEDAVPEGNGDSIRKYMAVAFSMILGFSGVVFCIAVMEFQSRKVNSVQEVNDGLGIRVVGELPNIGGRAFRRLKGGKGQNVLKALMAERIDGTRTALIHTTVIDPPRVVMITSAGPHEGKTTTSTQLAASLARSGRRTLLIDADVRNAGCHRVFEMPQDPGLCELLRGEVDRDAAIHPTRTANLWLMPAGRCDLRSVQALSGSYLGSAIAALSVQFDYVIIDAGPVLKVADPLLVGQHVDAAIVSVLKDHSTVPQVYEAVERLRSVGITVLGSVVNGVKDDVARHGMELLMAESHPQEPAATT